MGGKDAIHLKQLYDSSLQPNELQILLKKLADESFLNGKSGSLSMDNNGFQKKIKKNHIGPSIVSHSRKHNIISVRIRRGGIDRNQSHDQWLSTVSIAPDAISMSFVPITSLLKGVPGSGFLTHAVNHYLRYKPPIEELQQFLEFQIPRQWAPLFGDLPLAPRYIKQNFPFLRFSYTSSKLYIITIQVGTNNLPVTGIRLHLEGVKNNHLAIHLQHLSALPNTLKVSDDNDHISDMNIVIENKWDYSYYEPVKSSSPFFYVCTAPIQYNVSFIYDTAFIVTKCWLELKDINAKKVLFLRLGFSTVASAKIRRSEWDGPSSLLSRKPIGFNSSNLQSAMTVLSKEELNSALYPDGPPVPVRTGKMLKYVDTVESTRGPEDYPGYWVVTGAKLCIENGKILVKAKYSLLSILSEDDNLNIIS